MDNMILRYKLNINIYLHNESYVLVRNSDASN